MAHSTEELHISQIPFFLFLLFFFLLFFFLLFLFFVLLVVLGAGGCFVPGLHAHKRLSTPNEHLPTVYTIHTHQNSHFPPLELQSCLLCTRWLLLRLDLELSSCGHKQSGCVFGTHSFWNGQQKRSCARRWQHVSKASRDDDLGTSKKYAGGERPCHNLLKICISRKFLS